MKDINILKKEKERAKMKTAPCRCGAQVRLCDASAFTLWVMLYKDRSKMIQNSTFYPYIANLETV